jgi:renalase
MRNEDGPRVAIIGGGATGLAGARRFRESDVAATIFEKESVLGGRMATRVIKSEDGAEGVFDAGAQYFFAHTKRFSEMTNYWVERGEAFEWGKGFHTARIGLREDDDPRYAAKRGFEAFAEIVGEGLDVERGREIVRLAPEGEGWTLEDATGKTFRAEAAMLTTPVPLATALVDASGWSLPESIRTPLDKIKYDPCIAVLALLERESGVPEPGGVFVSGESVAWIADNKRKGISPNGEAVTLLASSEFSRTYWDYADEEIAARLMDEAEPWTCNCAKAYEVIRWERSQPYRFYEEPFAFVAHPAPLAISGDAFVSPHVEGAVNSGFAAAERLIAQLGG